MASLDHTGGLHGFREQCHKELRARDRWLREHGQKYRIYIPEDDARIIRDHIAQKKPPIEVEDHLKAHVQHDPSRVRRGEFARFVGGYQPFTHDSHVSQAKKDFPPPVWDNAVDAAFIQQNAKKHHRTKNWLKDFFEEQARHKNLIKQAYGGGGRKSS